MSANRRKRKSRNRNTAEPDCSAILFFSWHELAASCAIGAVGALYFAWTEGGSLYWFLCGLCIVGVPISVWLARRSIR
jgi:hypothetical protein